MKKSTNDIGYILHDKYQNIPLEFGSPVLVNNDNITIEYAKTLLAKPNGERFFASIPDKVDVAPAGDDSFEAEEDKLQKAFDAANEKLNNLAPNAHHKTKESAQNALDKAKADLDAHLASQQEEIEGIEVVITDEDLTTNSELAESGYEAGDVAIVDKKEYEDTGKIVLVEPKGE